MQLTISLGLINLAENPGRHTKRQYDRQHRTVSFAVGDWAWLCLHHGSHGSLTSTSSGKLRQCYFDPYKVIEMINSVDFHLALPPGARLHDVFHVGLLKKFVGTPPNAPPQLLPVHNGAIVPTPACVLRLWMSDSGIRQALVQWEGLPPSSASWENLEQFKKCYPQFQLEDELLLKGGSDVMWGKYYSRRRKRRLAQPVPEEAP
jgi:hypothetical protein